MLIHSVYFTISEANKKDCESFLAACAELAKIPGVKNFSTGKMQPGDRPVIQKDYDVAISMDLEDEAGLEHYMYHPEHVAFSEKWVKSGFVSQVKVYDFA